MGNIITDPCLRNAGAVNLRFAPFRPKAGLSAQQTPDSVKRMPDLRLRLRLGRDKVRKEKKMGTYNMIKSVMVLAALVLCVNVGFAENIDPYEDDSQYAYGQNVGWLNFEPNEGPGVTVSDANLTGFIWAENIGWINLRPENYGGVSNDGAGNLSGYAWGENVGWINFDPNVPGDVNDYGVTIDSEGNFSGWAWGENIGWINFNSADLYGYNVKACKVNFEDLANFVDYWLESDTGLPGDLSGNDEVNFVDYRIFANYWLDYYPGGWQLK